MIKYFLIVNKQGQTRLSKYYEQRTVEQKVALEAEIVRRCMARTPAQCSFLEFRDHRVVYRRYASLFFIVGVDAHENELAVFELLHHFLVTLDKMFDSVCELDIMLHLDIAHYVVDEMILNGLIIETNRASIIETVAFYSQD
jgi:AP-4 complex subunit sigma-1